MLASRVLPMPRTPELLEQRKHSLPPLLPARAKTQAVTQPTAAMPLQTPSIS